jgi:hypothetical protein
MGSPSLPEAADGGGARLLVGGSGGGGGAAVDEACSAELEEETALRARSKTPFTTLSRDEEGVD